MSWWLLVFLGVFLIGLTKSGFGAGVGLLNVPLITLAMSNVPGTHRGPDAALGLMLPLLITGDIISVYQYRHLFSLSIVKHLLPGTIVGVILGGVLLFWFHNQPPRIAVGLIQTEIGLESILLVGLHWWRSVRGIQHALLPEPLRSHLVGGFSAVSSTLAHAAGPIIAMYLLPLRLDRQLFVGTCAIYFGLLNCCKLPAYAFAGLFHKVSPLFSLEFLPLVVAGALIGFWMNRRMTDRFFSRALYFVTFALGWYVLYLGIIALLPHSQSAATP